MSDSEDDWTPTQESLRDKLTIDFTDKTIRKNLAYSEAQEDFYDPTSDILDQRWAVRHSRSQKGTVLSCPGCFTALCYDAIQDSESQYRASKVHNVKISSALTTDSGEEMVLGVVCKECGTRVAVYRPLTKIYHFFDFLTGYG
jgi:hypothetical protein